MKTKFVCKNCGSDKIQLRLFVDLNTFKVHDEIYNLDHYEPEETWCSDCETNSGIKEIKIK